MSAEQNADSEKTLCDFLLPETIVRQDGAGPVRALGGSQGKSLLITLGITRIVEQESLDLSIWGSPDGTEWGTKPLAAFPQKFYCGTYKLTLDLSRQPETAFLSVRWKLNRWGRGEPQPLFGLYVFAEETGAQSASAAGV